MFHIVIGAEEEYGRRLARYLERHFKEPARVSRFRDTEAFAADGKEEGAVYLLGEPFRCRLLEEGRWSREEEEKRCVILLARREREGCFCVYHDPAGLVRMIENCARKGDRGKALQAGALVSALYSPVYLPTLEREACAAMAEGDLYLSLEDIGGGDYAYHMGDLCYYIHLKEENILRHLKGMRREWEGRYVLGAPRLYYDAAAVSDEEYDWFFQKLREEGEYPRICVGVGNGVVKSPAFFRLFDEVILLERGGDPVWRRFGEDLGTVLANDARMRKGSFRIVRDAELRL